MAAPITQPIDLRHEALRLLSNGLYILTACDGDTAQGVAVSWVSQVSFRPPLVMLALRRDSQVLDAVRGGKRCALNVLAADQTDVASVFFRTVTVSAAAGALAGFPFRTSANHCPLLTNSLGWVECSIVDEPSAPGDHTILLGEVTGAGIRSDTSPMVLWNTPWAYGGLRDA